MKHNINGQCLTFLFLDCHRSSVNGEVVRAVRGLEPTSASGVLCGVWWQGFRYKSLHILIYLNAKSITMFFRNQIMNTRTHSDSHTLTSVLCVQVVTTEQSVVRDAKASSSGVWGRTWHTAAVVNRTASSTNTTATAASSVGWGNALKWGWRLSVS